MRVTFGISTIKRSMAVFVMLLLFAQAVPLPASAEETVTSIQLEGAASPVQLYVEDGTVSLILWANIQGSTTPRNVTAEAVWTSSSSSVKVDKGVLSANADTAAATVTAKYKTFAASANVKADYRYAFMKLQNTNGTDAPDTLDIELGNTLQFNATAYEYSGDPVASTGTAQWQTSNSNVATAAGGSITLLNPGIVTLTAKLKGRADSIILNVTSPYKALDITHSLGADPIDLIVGDPNYTLTAFATLKNASAPGPDVTAASAWTSSNSNVVKVDTGVVTAVGAGSAVVTAKRYGVANAVTFYVRTPYEALKVTAVKPLYMTLYGAQVELTAAGLKGSAAPVDVTEEAVWAAAEPMFISVEKSNGKVYVKPKSVGSTKLTVSYKGLAKELPVQVFPSVNVVQLPKDRLDVYEGESGTLPLLKGMTVAGDEIDVSKLAQWNSSDDSVLTIADGKWTAKRTGSVTLTAEVENEPDAPRKNDTMEVIVHKKVLILRAETGSVSVVIGKEADLPNVSLMYTDGEEKDVTAEMSWKSSSPNLLVTPDKIKGLLAASVTLTGTYLNKTVTVKVLVEEEFTSIDIQPQPLKLTINKVQTVKVTGTTKSGKKVILGSRVVWTTTSNGLVEVKGGSIKGLAEGSGRLTASIHGQTLELPFTVKSKLVKLTASETSVKLAAGGTANVKLTAAYENGKKLDPTKDAAWTSTNTKVATVTDGSIKAAAKGTATIKAVYEGKTVSIRITVK